MGAGNYGPRMLISPPHRASHWVDLTYFADNRPKGTLTEKEWRAAIRVFGDRFRGRFFRCCASRTRRAHPLGYLSKAHSHSRQLLAVATEFSGEYAKKFIQNRLRNNQMVAALTNARHSLLSPDGRVPKQNICIEDDSHCRRYRARSRSEGMPFCLAMRLQ